MRTDQSSFEKGIMQHAPRVRSFVRRQVKCAADADDLAQQTLLKAFRSRDSLRDERRLRAWLFRIARRTIIDYYRRRRPNEPFTDPTAESSCAEVDLISAAVARAALCYLGTLSEEYRMAVQMADYEGLPHAEIATRLGISLAAAKSRVRRGRQRIRALMDECCLMVYDGRGKVVDYERRRPCAGPTRG
jgi:RNA polymerase sigma-70 factor (ECF subfamily)